MLNTSTNTWILFTNVSYYYTTGNPNAYLTILRNIFDDYSHQVLWKIEVTAYIASRNVSGSSSMMIKVNFPPKYGSCYIDPHNGTTLTIFTINCSNWLDPDGTVISYTYYATLLNDQLNIGLGYSTNGILTSKIFAGAAYNLNQINICIQIYDEDQAFALYEIKNPVIVEPYLTDLDTVENRLIQDDPYFSSNIILHQGSYLSMIQEINNIASLLNIQSLSDKLGFIQSGNAYNFTQVYGPYSSYAGVNPVLI